MVENYKKYIEEISNETGFIKSTLEKVERLLNILEWINNHNKLSKLLALKGGPFFTWQVQRFVWLRRETIIETMFYVGIYSS